MGAVRAWVPSQGLQIPKQKLSLSIRTRSSGEQPFSDSWEEATLHLQSFVIAISQYTGVRSLYMH